MELINQVFSWVIKKRLHQIQLFIQYPMDVQQEVLFDLIAKAKNTEWGRKFDYGTIKSFKEYVERVPLQNYESIEPYTSRVRRGESNILWPTPTKWFAKSSGTETGKSKLIPVTKESLFDCHYKGGKDLLAIYHHNHVHSKLIMGKVLVVGGTGGKDRFDSYCGDLSAVIMDNFPKWVESRRVPKKEVALMMDWEAKIEKMATLTAQENVSNISGVPSWTLLLLRKILEIQKKDNILEVWPNLELFMHGGVNFSPYKEQFKALIPNETMNYYENYNASEGFFALQDKSDEKGLLLMLDYGIFYEFIVQEELHLPTPKTITLESVELGKTYAIVISTNSGLWRYVVGDTIEFVSLNPFRIRVKGRIKHYINAFGEELIVDNAENAIATACQKTNALVKEFTAAPIYMTEETSGKHQWLVEFEKVPTCIKGFSEVLDQELKSLNSDYEAKRYKNTILLQPEVVSLNRGTFYKWMKKNNRLGGQYKVPRLSNHRLYVDEILKLV